MRALFIGLLLLVGATSVPNFAFAQGGGLVAPPCTPGENGCPAAYEGGESSEAARYGTCEFVATVNNVIQFIVRIGAIIAVLILVYGAFLLVTSAGNPGALAQTKTLMSNIIIGYIIVLAGFLIVNTILSGLLDSDSPVFGWQTIECSYPTEVTKATEVVEKFEAEDSLIGSAGDDLLSDAFFSNKGVCSEDFLGQYFSGKDVAIAACVAQGESACGAYFESTVDIASDGNAFSLSAFQINLSVHEIQDCAEYGASSDYLDCKASFAGKDWNSRVVDAGLYRQCAEALADKRCAAKNAARLRARDGWGIWTQYRKNGCNIL